MVYVNAFYFLFSGSCKKHSMCFIGVLTSCRLDGNPLVLEMYFTV